MCTCFVSEFCTMMPVLCPWWALVSALSSGAQGPAMTGADRFRSANRSRSSVLLRPALPLLLPTAAAADAGILASPTLTSLLCFCAS